MQDQDRSQDSDEKNTTRRVKLFSKQSMKETTVFEWAFILFLPVAFVVFLLDIGILQQWKPSLTPLIRCLFWGFFFTTYFALLLWLNKRDSNFKSDDSS